MGIDKNKIVATPATELRRHAEEQLCAKPKKVSGPMSKHDTQCYSHELEVHQVELEHDHIPQVLQKANWRIEGANGAAVLLGLNASTLRARMRKYGIVRQ